METTTTMNLASSTQLELIDKLREIGVSDIIALPQVLSVSPSWYAKLTMNSLPLWEISRGKYIANQWLQTLTISAVRARYSRASPSCHFHGIVVFALGLLPKSHFVVLHEALSKFQLSQARTVTVRKLRSFVASWGKDSKVSPVKYF